MNFARNIIFAQMETKLKTRQTPTEANSGVYAPGRTSYDTIVTADMRTSLEFVNIKFDEDTMIAHSR